MNSIFKRLTSPQPVATKKGSGLSKKEIAIILDKSNPLYSFSKETGATSYKRYSKCELLALLSNSQKTNQNEVQS